MSVTNKLPAMLLDDDKNLRISGEYIPQADTCECGQEWTHIIFYPSGGWLQTCANCAAMAKWITHRNTLIMSKDKAMSIASTRVRPTRKVVEHRTNWRTVFWREEVLPWLYQQNRPVSPDEVAKHFDKSLESSRSMLKKFASEGHLQIIRHGAWRKSFVPNRKVGEGETHG